MTRILNALLSLAILPVLWTSAGAYPAALPKNDPALLRPADSVESSGQVPDCSEAPVLTIDPGFEQILSGDTTGQPSLVDAYACQPWEESGPEAVYTLVVNATTNLMAQVASATADLDLFLLSDCDSDSCLVASSREFMTTLPAGSYTLVVDGYHGAAGVYNLTIAGSPAGLATAVCDSAVVIPVANGPQQIEGEVCDRVNYVTIGGNCGQYLAFGGEAWYRLDLVKAQDVEIVVSDLSADLHVDFALWLFGDCGDNPVCLGYADAGTGGAAESLSYHNATGGPQSILLGVDTIRPYASAEDGICYEGTFELRLTGAVPTSQSSLGALKRRFR